MGGADASPFAYSHLLARRGLAERIGNLVGRLQFSDDQLQKTQKGLKDAGVPMPNFGNVGRELALEINEEPEETEEESQCLSFSIVFLSPFSSS
jgi:Ras GTPase-activating-like protein IQGAP2/3